MTRINTDDIVDNLRNLQDMHAKKICPTDGTDERIFALPDNLRNLSVVVSKQVDVLLRQQRQQ